MSAPAVTKAVCVLRRSVGSVRRGVEDQREAERGVVGERDWRVVPRPPSRRRMGVGWRGGEEGRGGWVGEGDMVMMEEPLLMLVGSRRARKD
jgi:hypothetical protein